MLDSFKLYFSLFFFSLSSPLSPSAGWWSTPWISKTLTCLQSVLSVSWDPWKPSTVCPVSCASLSHLPAWLVGRTSSIRLPVVVFRDQMQGSGTKWIEASVGCVQALPHHRAKRCCWMGRKTTVSQNICPGHPLCVAMLMELQELKVNNMQ